MRIGVLRGPLNGAQRTPVGGDGPAVEDKGGVPSDVGLLVVPEEAGKAVADESAALEMSEDKLSWPVADCGESGRGPSRACGAARCASGDADGVVLVMGGVFGPLLLLPRVPCWCGCWRVGDAVVAAALEEVACSKGRLPAAWSCRCWVGAHWRARPSSSVTGGPFSLRRRLDRRHRSCIH